MTELNFDAGKVDPSQGFTVYESGTYDVMITGSDQKETAAKKAGTATEGSYLQFNMRIASGDHAGGTLIARVNFENDNPVAVEIGQAELSAICRVCGVMQLQDTQQLHGIPFKVAVVKSERNDKPGEYGNEIKGYFDTNGNPPEKAGQGPAGSGGNGAFGADPTPPATDPTPPPVVDTPPPPAGMQKPTDPAHIHAAGTPEEKWWDGTAWVEPTVIALPDPTPPPADPTPPPPATTPPVDEAPAPTTDGAAPPPWAK